MLSLLATGKFGNKPYVLCKPQSLLARYCLSLFVPAFWVCARALGLRPRAGFVQKHSPWPMAAGGCRPQDSVCVPVAAWCHHGGDRGVVCVCVCACPHTLNPPTPLASHMVVFRSCDMTIRSVAHTYTERQGHSQKQTPIKVLGLAQLKRGRVAVWMGWLVSVTEQTWVIQATSHHLTGTNLETSTELKNK